MTLGRRIYHTIVLVLAIVTVIILFDKCRDGRASEWQQRAAVAEARAAVLEGEVREARARSDSLSALAADSAQEANEAEIRIVARIDTVRVETPPELRDHPAIVERDAIIDEQQEQIARWRSAYDLQTRALAALQVATDKAVERGDSLAAVLKDRPGDRPWWLPRLGVGPAAGFDMDGRARALPASVNLSWEISL